MTISMNQVAAKEWAAKVRAGEVAGRLARQLLGKR